MNRYDFTVISFYLNGKLKTAEIPPAMTTLDYVNKELGLHGTKCSCNEGDCGACTVVIASAREGAIAYEAINSCLYPAAKLNGKHLITIEGLGSPEKLHPVQQAMLDFHATQCGYCTPGFVMSAFALFAMRPKPTREEIMAALEGNLCRCTGYDSIYKAMEDLAERMSPEEIIPVWARAVEPMLFAGAGPAVISQRDASTLYNASSYYLPQNLGDLDEILRNNPDISFINGGTDVMVGVNIQKKKHGVMVDITAIPELRRIYLQRDGVHIGAVCTYTEIMESGIVRTDIPAFLELIPKVASRQIRNFGTLSGNIANASPVGDSLPLLLVLDAKLKLYHQGLEREVRLADFYTGYKQTVLKPGEIIKEIIISPTSTGEYIRFSKAAKRNAVDISAISSACRIAVNDSGVVTTALLALGGAAATPKLSGVFGKLVGKTLDLSIAKQIAEEVRAEFSPISDVRGSAEYRATLIYNHVYQYLAEFIAGGAI